MAPLSKKQIKALEMVESLKDRFGYRMFTKHELPGITMHTMDALVHRGYFEVVMFNNIHYYKLIKENDES